MSDKLWNEMSGGFEVSNHTFVKLLSEGLANKVKSINKDLGLKLIDKKVRNKNINGTLVSTLTIEGEDLDRAGIYNFTNLVIFVTKRMRRES